LVTILVRDARPAEHGAIAALLRDTYGEFVPDEYLDRVADVGARAAMPATDVLVALDTRDGAVVGTATYVQPGSELLDALPPDVDTSRAWHAGMRMMAVARSVRNQGVGRALVSECMARAQLAGYAEMGFVTAEPMVAAQELYRKLGFSRAPERDKYVPSGERLPAYVRALAPWPVVREAQPDELNAAGELTAEAYTTDGFVNPEDAYVDSLRDTAERAERAVLLVAVDRSDHAVAGTVTYCPVGSPYREIGTSSEAEFRMLAVSSDARGNGVGEALVRAVLARAHADGMTGVALSSLEVMTAAHRLYRRLGFTRDPERDWHAPEVRLWAFAREV
jgi:ribosomal protein S18 acetylase RimI-like enzyme